MLKKIILSIIAIVALPLIVMAINVTVPVSPGAGYVLISTTTGAYNYTASTTLPYIASSSASLYVPYTGATTNVNLGNNSFTVSGTSTLATTTSSLLRINNWTLSTSTVVCMAPDTCQYQADGTADDVQIQAAINYVNSLGGGIVFVKMGTYNLSSNLLVKNNVSLNGDGRNSILYLNNNVNLPVIIIDNTVIRAAVSEFTINGNASNNTSPGAYGNMGIWVNATGTHIYNNNITNVAGNGIEFLGTTNSLVDNNLINNSGQGIRLTVNSNYNEIINNIIDSNSYGIFVYDNGSTTYSSYYNKIIGNTVSNSSGTNGALAQAAGISLTGAPHSLVSNNLVKNNATRGIEVFSGSPFSIITGNHVISNGSTGIDTGPDSNLVISNNVVELNGGGGIYLSGLLKSVISGNQIINNGQSATSTDDQNGITMQENSGSGTEPVNDNIITNNLITDTQGTTTQKYGIREYWTGTANPSWYLRNVISGNNLKGNKIGDISFISTTDEIYANILDTISNFNVTGTSTFNGNVGIGTITPVSTLEVFGTTTRRLFLQPNPITNPQTIIASEVNTATDYLGFAVRAGTTPGALTDGSFGDIRMIINGNGNVGIGTLNPLTKLVISNGGAGGLEFSPGDTYEQIVGYNRNTLAYTNIVTNIGGGNFGIGTTVPPNKLTVWGTGTLPSTIAGVQAIFGNTDGFSNSGIAIITSSGNSNSILFGSTTVTDAGRIVYSPGVDSMGFYTNTTEKVNISSVGNVGIGTTTSPAKLNIIGTTGTSDSFIVSSSSNAAYFKIGYTGQVVNGGITPTIATSTGAGSTSTASIVGTDNGGEITVNTSVIPTAGALIATVTYSKACPNDSYPILFPANAVTALLSGVTMVYSTGGTTTFTITAGSTALTALSTYVWNYHVMCR